MMLHMCLLSDTLQRLQCSRLHAFLAVLQSAGMDASALTYHDGLWIMDL